MVGLVVIGVIFVMIMVVLAFRTQNMFDKEVESMQPGDIYYYVKLRSNPWEQDVVLYAEVLEVKEQWVKYMHLDTNRLRFGKALWEKATHIEPASRFLSLYHPYEEGQTEFVYPDQSEM